MASCKLAANFVAKSTVVVVIAFNAAIVVFGWWDPLTNLPVEDLWVGEGCRQHEGIVFVGVIHVCPFVLLDPGAFRGGRGTRTREG